MNHETVIEILVEIQDKLKNEYREELNDIIKWLKDEYNWDE